MAKSNTKKSQPQYEDEATEQGNATEAAADEQPDVADAAESAPTEAQPEATAAPATPTLPLHTRLEKAVRTMSHSGNPDAAHALNKVELLVGTLKHSLPAAISAVSDDQVKADLQSLLALL